jgi:hypothetical protein
MLGGVRAPAPALASALALAFLALPAAARAGEGESGLSATAGFATFTLGPIGASGGAIGAEYERGISESLSWRVALDGAVFYTPADEEEEIAGGTSYGGRAVVGLIYLLDVLKYVPYATGGVGLSLVGGGPLETEVHPVVEIGGGLDVLHSRNLSYGAWGRLQSFVDDSAGFNLGLRVTYRWGYF